jgi:L-ascorbate metabolism protein UlaG (beta-lactamase superfamily)
MPGRDTGEARARQLNARGDHFDGRRFFNPTQANGQPTTAVPRMLFERRKAWPARVPVDPRRPPALDGATAIVSFVGHATLLIQTRFGNLLTDPMYSDRASPVAFAGPRRTRQPAIRFDDLPAISLVLLSHNHYDHCDLPTLRAIEDRWQPLIVTPLGNSRLLQAAGVRRIQELDWWQEATDVPLPIALTPAQHFSARTPFDRNRALWGGFMLDVGAQRIFFGGDSGYGPHFTQIRERLGAPDLAFLPIGAYEPRWFMKDIHMNPAEAVQAHLDLGSTRSLGIHFGTFQLTTEGIDDPVIALGDALRAHGLPADQFRAPEFGESFTLS